jgi:hypothetical protein
VIKINIELFKDSIKIFVLRIGISVLQQWKYIFTMARNDKNTQKKAAAACLN